MSTVITLTELPRLPWELMDGIIDHLQNDLPTLGQCGMVSSAWLKRSRHHIFSTVQLWPWRIRDFLQLSASKKCTFSSSIQRVELDDSRVKPGVPCIQFMDALSLSSLSCLSQVEAIQIRSVDWTALTPTEQAKLRHRFAHFKMLKLLEFDDVTFHDLREVVNIRLSTPPPKNHRNFGTGADPHVTRLNLRNLKAQHLPYLSTLVRRIGSHVRHLLLGMERTSFMNVDEGDYIRALKLSRLSQLRTLQIEGLKFTQKQSLLEASLPELISRLESPFLRCISTTFDLDAFEDLENFDWKNLQRVFKELHFFGLQNVEVHVIASRDVGSERVENWIRDALKDLDQNSALSVALPFYQIGSAAEFEIRSHESDDWVLGPAILWHASHSTVLPSTMPELLGFDFWIDVEGDRQEEYGVKHQKESEFQEIICTIPCEAGKVRFLCCVLEVTNSHLPAKEFRIGYNIPSHLHYDYGFRFMMDGKSIRALSYAYVPRANSGKSPRYPKYIEGKNLGGGIIAPFQFSRLTQTDDDAYLHVDNTGLGEICVLIHTVERREYIDRIEGPCPEKSQQPDLSTLTDQNTGSAQTQEQVVKLQDGAARVVHETEKKMLKCFVNSSESENEKIRIKTVTARKYTWVRPQLVGRILFRYRDLDILIAQGLAPPPPAEEQDPNAWIPHALEPPMPNHAPLEQEILPGPMPAATPASISADSNAARDALKPEGASQPLSNPAPNGSDPMPIVIPVPISPVLKPMVLDSDPSDVKPSIAELGQILSPSKQKGKIRAIETEDSDDLHSDENELQNLESQAAGRIQELDNINARIEAIRSRKRARKFQANRHAGPYLKRVKVEHDVTVQPMMKREFSSVPVGAESHAHQVKLVNEVDVKSEDALLCNVEVIDLT
ncbi:hypothetical protein H1R20_g4601, partial [Candolleomyces eurysporus]